MHNLEALKADTCTAVTGASGVTAVYPAEICIFHSCIGLLFQTHLPSSAIHEEA